MKKPFTLSRTWRSAKILAMFVALFALATGTKANPVDMKLAREVGAKFINANTAIKVAPDRDLQWVATYRTMNDDAAFHVFNMPKGFVIVSADDCAIPVLGYSKNGHFDTDDVPPQMEDYLQGFVKQIQYGIDNHLVADEDIAHQWELVKTTGFIKEGKGTDAVQPLLSDIWSQGCYYNTFCPEDPNGSCGHVVTGCVATSFAQIMHYWGYPAVGTGSHTYTPEGYPQQTANFGETTYQWSIMPNSLTSSSTSAQINAVATLLWHCGVAVEMNYGPNGSSASSADIPAALVNYFNYSNDLSIVYRDNYNSTQWLTLIKDCLNLGRPVHYRGSDENGGGGHAFVCDGYDNNDYLHFNWGWGGYCNDNYFADGALNPDDYAFNISNAAIINIHPNCNSGTSYQVTASASPSYGGAVSGTGAYGCGEVCTLTANPANGYMFCSWTEGGTVISTQPTYSFTVMGARNLVANFYQNTGDACALVFNLVDSWGDGWNGNALTVSYSSGCIDSEQLTIEGGSSATFTRNVIDGSHIVLGWINGSYINECSFTVSYENGTVIYEGSDLSNTFSYEFDVDCDAVPTYYTISASANPAEGGTVSGGGSIAYGATCTLTATANSGYRFTSWTKDGATVSINPFYSFTVTEDASFVANFVAITPPGPALEVVAEYYPDASDPNSQYVKVSWSEIVSGSSFYYDFEDSAVPAGWTTIDADGDGNTWDLGTVVMGSGYGHNGSNDLILSKSYDNNTGILYPDNYLVSEQVNIVNGSHLSFYACAQDNAYAAEHFGVFVSLGSNTNANDFQEVQCWTMTAKGNSGRVIEGRASRNSGSRAQGNWYFYDVDLSDYVGTGYIAIRHFDCSDMFYLNVDEIQLSDTRNGRSTYSIYRASCDGGEEVVIAENITGNEYIDADWGEIDLGNYKYGVGVTSGRFLGEPSLVSYDDGWLYYDDGTYATSVGIGDGSTIYWASMFPANELTPYVGNNLTKVALYENSYNTETVTVSIYLGGDNAPQTLMSSLSYNPVGGNAFNEVELNTPVMIDGTHNLWIVFSEYGTYPANACNDSGEPNDRWISLDGDTWSDLTSVGLNYMWMIRGYLEDGGEAIAWSNCIEKMVVESFTINATANPLEGGTVDGAGTYDYGTTATMTAEANQGYTFVNWTENGTQVSANATYSFTVTGDRDLVANFSSQDYIITASANPEEGGIITGSGGYDYGETCILTAEANPGYTFVNWTKDGTEVSNGTIYSFTVTETASYVANFNLNSYAITVTADPEEGGTVDGDGMYNHGETATLTAEANPGYTFVNWTKDGTEVSNGTIYSFTVTEEGDYVANFSLNSYEITVTADPEEGGTVSGAGTYDYGTTATLTAEANDHYTFVNWTKDGTEVSTEAAYSFTVTEAGDYVANFSLTSHEVTVAADPADGGTVTGAGTYEYGTTITVEVTLNPNYSMDNWTLNGAVVSEDLTYTFAVTEDCQLVAHLTFFDEVGEDVATALTVYPNPAKNTINLRGVVMQSVMVYNALGQLVIAKEFDNAETVELDLGGLDAGAYMVAVRLTNGAVVNKLIMKE